MAEPVTVIVTDNDAPPIEVVIAQPDPVIVVELAEVGLVGPPGPGSGYTHTQTTPAAQWTVTHGLGRPTNPTVLLDDDPDRPVWVDTLHPDPNTTLLIMPEPHSGVAYF